MYTNLLIQCYSIDAESVKGYDKSAINVFFSFLKLRNLVHTHSFSSYFLHFSILSIPHFHSFSSYFLQFSILSIPHFFISLLFHSLLHISPTLNISLPHSHSHTPSLSYSRNPTPPPQTPPHTHTLTHPSTPTLPTHTPSHIICKYHLGSQNPTPRNGPISAKSSKSQVKMWQILPT